jgi:hypothetical protein
MSFVTARSGRNQSVPGTAVRRIRTTDSVRISVSRNSSVNSQPDAARSGNGSSSRLLPNLRY